jgi:hypothetical protein
MRCETLLATASADYFRPGAITRLPQQKILVHEPPHASGKRCATIAAGYLAVFGFWTGFCFDEFIERVAARAIK